MKHRGPGDVTFSPTDQMSMPDGMEILTRGTFSEPGDYVLRVQAYKGRSPFQDEIRGNWRALGSRPRTAILSPQGPGRTGFQ